VKTADAFVNTLRSESELAGDHLGHGSLPLHFSFEYVIGRSQIPAVLNNLGTVFHT
jgi:hypothetical protein